MFDDLDRIKSLYVIPVEYGQYVGKREYFTQLDMCLVQVLLLLLLPSLPQAAFFAAVLVYPRHYGGQGAGQEELEAFLHVWRWGTVSWPRDSPQSVWILPGHL